MSELEVEQQRVELKAGWNTFRKMRLYCTNSGRVYLSVGPHWYGPVLTTLVIGFVFTLNRVIIDRSKCTEDTKVILFYVAALLCAIGEFFMICTALIDSGILVIKSEDEESQSLVGRGTIPYCDTCMLFQINKAAHCSFCDCCVEELDHHCPWMGKCIGKGNMFWFKCFMGTVVIFMIQFAVVGLKYS